MKLTIFFTSEEHVTEWTDGCGSVSTDVYEDDTHTKGVKKNKPR